MAADRQTDTQTHRSAWPQYIFCRLRLTQNVTSTLYWITTNTSATYTTRPSCSLLHWLLTFSTYHNLGFIHIYSHTSIRPQVTCTENFMKFGHALFETCKQTDRQTYRYAHHNTLDPYRGQCNEMKINLKYLIAGSNLLVETCNVLTLFDICTESGITNTSHQAQ